MPAGPIAILEPAFTDCLFKYPGFADHTNTDE